MSRDFQRADPEFVRSPRNRFYGMGRNLTVHVWGVRYSCCVCWLFLFVCRQSYLEVLNSLVTLQNAYLDSKNLKNLFQRYSRLRSMIKVWLFFSVIFVLWICRIWDNRAISNFSIIFMRRYHTMYVYKGYTFTKFLSIQKTDSLLMFNFMLTIHICTVQYIQWWKSIFRQNWTSLKVFRWSDWNKRWKLSLDSGWANLNAESCLLIAVAEFKH